MYTLRYYQLAVRACNSSAIAWTLLAVAVRLGNAMRLGQEDARMFDPFELQMRRRLWYDVCALDTYFSLDRGTTEMIHYDDLGPEPLYLDDTALHRGHIPASSTPGFHDMSFCELMYRAMVNQKHMLSIADTNGNAWERKVAIVTDFGQWARATFVDGLPDSAPPLQRFAAQAALALTTAMQLILRRPPYKQRSSLVPANDDFDVLEHATLAVEHELSAKSPDFAPWAWKSWVQWYSLAIVLAELCTQPFGPMYDRSYTAAVLIFDRYSTLVADNDVGALWRPIAKLMRRVQQRHKTRASVGSDSQAKRNGQLQDTKLQDGVHKGMEFFLDPIYQGLDTSRAVNAMDIYNTTVEPLYPQPQAYWSMFMDEVDLNCASDHQQDPFSWNNGAWSSLDQAT